ncbi:hypothetical protein IW148_002753 [Coemansia sp. RSA 1199]|nr:hypothetical protein IW148_002753 [Coemansia sp. RSA 1199]
MQLLESHGSRRSSIDDQCRVKGAFASRGSLSEAAVTGYSPFTAGAYKIGLPSRYT